MDLLRDNRPALVSRISALAKAQGVTLKHLCECIGKRRTFLGEVRLERDYIDSTELAIIADRLHTTPEYLTGATDDPSQPAQPDVPTPSVDDDAVTPEFLATLSSSTRQIYEMIEALPDDKRQEAIDYIEYIIARSQGGTNDRR